MLPLSFAQAGDAVMVSKIGGSDEMKQHLEDLGFVVGARVRVISQSGNGNVIVNLKESRLAITDQMAAKVQVVPSEPDIK
jgi:ferrous iron transport protein A